MAKFIMLSGLPGCGKSTVSQKIALKEDAVILSSDELYVELTGDTEHQKANDGVVFQELYKRAREHLKKGKSVIMDATNISAKRRKGLLQQFNVKEKECYYIATPFDRCVEQDAKRDRTVGYGVIKGMYLRFFVPFENEGFTKVHYVVNDAYKEELSGLTKEDFEEVLNKKGNHFEVFEPLKVIKYFNDIYNLSQDSTYHAFSISRHIYHVLQYINDNYHGEDKLVMQYTALFHDVGKGPAKKFKDESRYASFIGHENTSAQIAFGLLSALEYEEEFVKKVTNLVQLHMRMPRRKTIEDVLEKIKKDIDEKSFEAIKEKIVLKNEGASDKAFEKFKSEVGEEVYKKLEFFREADDQAK